MKDSIKFAIVVGPQKAGTTWIYEYLKKREDVGLPAGVKETFYFDRFYDRGLQWYINHFDLERAQNSIFMEVAPTYFHSDKARTLLKNELGNVRIVCTLRNPIERTYSLYLHMYRYGMTKLPFSEALIEHPELLETSRYAKHLSMWFEQFGKDNVLVLFQKQLRHAPEEFVREICKHVGLDYLAIPESIKRPINEASVPRSYRIAAFGQRSADFFRNIGLYSVVNFAKFLGLKGYFFGKPGARDLPVISNEDRNRVYEYLSTDIENLEKLLKLDLGRWRA